MWALLCACWGAVEGHREPPGLKFGLPPRGALRPAAISVCWLWGGGGRLLLYTDPTVLLIPGSPPVCRGASFCAESHSLAVLGT